MTGRRSGRLRVLGRGCIGSLLVGICVSCLVLLVVVAAHGIIVSAITVVIGRSHGRACGKYEDDRGRRRSSYDTYGDELLVRTTDYLIHVVCEVHCGPSRSERAGRVTTTERDSHTVVHTLDLNRGWEPNGTLVDLSLHKTRRLLSPAGGAQSSRHTFKEG